MEIASQMTMDIPEEETAVEPHATDHAQDRRQPRGFNRASYTEFRGIPVPTMIYIGVGSPTLGYHCYIPGVVRPTAHPSSAPE